MCIRDRNRHTLSRADQLAVQLRDDQTDGLSSTGGVGDDVLCCLLYTSPPGGKYKYMNLNLSTSDWLNAALGVLFLYRGIRDL